jgi:DNA/RNA-binding domain of Phe-tRNA-synthetase-like protein
MTANFNYDSALIERFPTIRAGVVHAAGLTNGLSSASLLEAYSAEQQEVAKRLEETPIAELASISAWRRTFTGFGVKPTQHRVAAEALLRRLSKAGDIPSISTLVDIGNLVSIRYGLPVAVFDQIAVTGSTTVRFADGSEKFTDLGSTDVIHPQPGEVVFVDDANLVSARRWCWRQSAQSATGPNTVAALVTIEAQHAEGEADVAAALTDLQELLSIHQPAAATTTRRLDASNPSVTFEP